MGILPVDHVILLTLTCFGHPYEFYGDIKTRIQCSQHRRLAAPVDPVCSELPICTFVTMPMLMLKKYLHTHACASGFLVGTHVLGTLNLTVVLISNSYLFMCRRHFLVDKLEFEKVRDSVAVHVPCSSKKMGIEDAFTKLAGMCAHEVVPTGVPCCGMAGDRGLRYPELTGGALQHLNLPKDCTGVSRRGEGRGKAS